MVDTRSQQFGVLVNIGVDGLVAQHRLPECLIAHLDSLSEGRVLQQSLPESRGWVGVSTLEAPGLDVVGVAEVTVAISQVVVPYRTCHQLAASTIGMHLLLIEIGTPLIAIGIQAEFGVDEIVDERRHIDIARIAPLGVGEVVRLDDLLHSIYETLDISHLLRLQVLFLGIDTRPRDLTGHDAIANTWHLRREGGIVLIERVDAQQIATSDVASLGVALLQLIKFYTLISPLDGLREDIDAAILTVECEFHHACAWSPMSHVAPQLKGQWVAYCRHIVVGGQQHPVAVGRHAHQGCIHLLAIVVTQFDGVFLLIKR